MLFRSPDLILNLAYIDDVVIELIKLLNQKETLNFGYSEVKPVYKINLGKLAELLYSFNSSKGNLLIPNMGDDFTRKLYASYLSYIPKSNFKYDLKMNVDNRGSFSEFIKSPVCGQVSVNVSKPGIIKGNHWHQSKNEKFLVVSGVGVIRFRKINETEVIEYFVSGEKLQVVDIPPGYTHNIENLGITNMVTVMWVSERFNAEKPDTIFLEV